MSSNFADVLLDLNHAILDKFDKSEYIVNVTRDSNNIIIEYKSGHKVLIEVPLEIQGLNGKDGIDGVDGIDGRDGVDGINGKDGRIGNQGLQGIQGVQGVAGKDGKNGVDGKDGKNGHNGIDGKDGANVIDAHIDNSGHLIIKTTEKEIDAGIVRKFTLGHRQGGRSGGGSGIEFKYTNSLPMPSSIGGFEAGTTFDQMPLNELFTGLLYASAYPSFSYFNISGLSDLEVGDTIQGNYTAQWLVANPSLLQADSISIYFDNTVERLAENLADTSSHVITIPPITYNTQTNAQFSIVAFNTSLIQFSRTFSVNFLYKIYVGESALETLEDADVTALRLSVLKDKPDGEYQMLEGEYKWFCYPFIKGVRTKFFDVDTGFDVEMDDPDLTTVTNGFGVSALYYCYRTYYKLGGAIKIGISE